MEQTKQYEYVDLGLPSGLKWAKCNVGATSETDYGSYFQWGDIEDKSNSDYSWESYKYCNGSYNTMTKYCMNSSYGTVDNKTKLEDEDDAAIQNLRSQSGHEDARMPTASEYQTLYNETLWVWCPGGNVGIKKTDESGNESIEYIAYPTGYFVFKTNSDKKQRGTFDKDEDGNLIGYTAKSGTVYYPGAHKITEGDANSIADDDTHIFFPASGGAYGTGVNYRGSYGYFWSSSLHPSISNYGLSLYFYSGGINPQGSSRRYLGFCVRSVLRNK